MCEAPRKKGDEYDEANAIVRLYRGGSTLPSRRKKFKGFAGTEKIKSPGWGGIVDYEDVPPSSQFIEGDGGGRRRTGVSSAFSSSFLRHERELTSCAETETGLSR